MCGYDFKGANEQQIEAITTVDGPVLITAGPGTGKTFTLVQRAVYLMSEKKVKPKQILMSTFTNKAAAEMITRITNELADRPALDENINDMYIGTFHNICLRILDEHLEYTNLKRNYKVLDEFGQRYMVLKHKNEFFGGRDYKISGNVPGIPGIDDVIPKQTVKNGRTRYHNEWDRVGDICRFVNKLSEELVDQQSLMQDNDPKIVTLGYMLSQYQSILRAENAVDFPGQLVECYRLLRDHPEVLSELQDQIKYFMIDEYQDTNYVQERILFLLGGKTCNICVVGDDDQALYRFRGATVENILKFPDRFETGECKIVSLTKNYRSNKDIVDFYNKWMTDYTHGFFSWDGYRYEKTIEATQPSEMKSPGVAKLDEKSNQDKWMEGIFNFLSELKSSGAISDYNQAAFLFRSVKYGPAVSLANYLEENGIQVYSPRSGMYFDRKEIKLVIGCLLNMFPQYLYYLNNDHKGYLPVRLKKYYDGCLDYVNKGLTGKYNELKQFINQLAQEHRTLQGATDYSFSGLMYMMFQFDPFLGWLDADSGSGMKDVRPARNLAIFSQIMAEFDQMEDVSVISQVRIDFLSRQLFGSYLKSRYGQGIEEYEDETEYAPSGCVSFLTIHQAKGMEFPIVIVDSLDNGVKQRERDLLDEVEENYYLDENGNKREPYEPFDSTNSYDFWRTYYVAFSRAQNLLVLTSGTHVSPEFEKPYQELIDVRDADHFFIDEFNFKQLKESNIKPVFSFTSHISVYDTCSLQYKFYSELGFAPVRNSAAAFGTLVHETIEDIHRAVLRGEEDSITYDQIEEWFDSNYNSLKNAKLVNPGKINHDAALKQVKDYADRHAGQWDRILRTEEDLMLAEPGRDFILKGRVDLIRGDGDSVELVDFKTEDRDELIKNPKQLERYRRQLQLYAHLVEELGKEDNVNVSKMHLYFTKNQDSSASPAITFDYDEKEIKGVVDAFADTVKHIMDKDYSHRADQPSTCSNCDFRHYCRRGNVTVGQSEE